MSKNKFDDKEIDIVLEKSEEICKKLNYILQKECRKLNELRSEKLCTRGSHVTLLPICSIKPIGSGE